MPDVRARVVIGGQDVAGDGLEARISWGRDSADEQPAGAVASVLCADPNGVIAAHAEVGATVDIYAVVAGTERQRFAGTVVDAAIGHAAGETVVTATDELGRLARTYIGDEPWPAELDGARIERILALAGVDLAGAGPWNAQTGTWAAHTDTWRIARVPLIDPGTVTIGERDVDRRGVLELLQQTAGDAVGLIYTDRRGYVNYRDAEHRPARTERTVPAFVFISDATFVRGTGGVINRARYTYGPTDAQLEVTVEDPISIGAYGVFDRQRTTQLANLADAESLARAVVAARRFPRWSAPLLTFDLAALDDELVAPADLDYVLSAGVGSCFAVSGIAPPDPSSGGTALLVVEGGTDTIGAGNLEIEFVTSNLRMIAPPLVWDDAPGTWAEVPADVAWLDADDLAPPAEIGA